MPPSTVACLTPPLHVPPLVSPRPPPPPPLIQAHIEVPQKGRAGKKEAEVFDFVPPEVLGQEAGYAEEPRWSSLPQMSFMEFYQVGWAGGSEV